MNIDTICLNLEKLQGEQLDDFFDSVVMSCPVDKVLLSHLTDTYQYRYFSKFYLESGDLCRVIEMLPYLNQQNTWNFLVLILSNEDLHELTMVDISNIFAAVVQLKVPENIKPVMDYALRMQTLVHIHENQVNIPQVLSLMDDFYLYGFERQGFALKCILKMHNINQQL